MPDITAGSTNVSLYVYFVDDDGGTAPGEPTTGLLFSNIETGGSASYVRQGAARTDFTLVTLASASAAHTDGGFILVDDTNMPGLYRVDVPDAAFAAGADFVIIQLVAAAANNTIMRPLEVMLPDVDFGDTVRMGLTALPNAAADAAGGLAISDAGGLDLDSMKADLDTITGAAGVVLDSTATSAQLVDDIWDELLTGGTHNVTNSAGKRLRQLGQSFIITEGTAQAGTANTITLAAGESSVDDIYRGDRIVIFAGTGVAEHGIITSYNGTTKVATMSENWVVTPDATSEYELTPADVDVETWQHVTVTNSATTSLPCVDTRSISDDATAADNLELDYDGTGYNKANSTIGTTTTNTDMRGTDSALLAASAPTNFGDLSITATTGRVDLAAILGVAATKLEASTDTILIGTASGTPTTTTMVSGIGITVDDQLNGRTIIFASDTSTAALRGQATDITACTAATNTLTFTALTTAPVSGDTFVVV
jgi:hypothetical protein